jgi:hypothetical protein
MDQVTRDALRAVWRWRFLIIAIVLVATAAAAVLGSYFFKTVPVVIARVDPGPLAGAVEQGKDSGASSAARLAQLARGAGLVRKTVAELDPEGLKLSEDNVLIATVEQNPYLEVRVSLADQEAAAQLARELGRNILELAREQRLQELERQIQSAEMCLEAVERELAAYPVAYELVVRKPGTEILFGAELREGRLEVEEVELDPAYLRLLKEKSDQQVLLQDLKAARETVKALSYDRYIYTIFQGEKASGKVWLFAIAVFLISLLIPVGLIWFRQIIKEA